MSTPIPAPFKRVENLVDLLRERAQHNPETPAYSYLLDGEKQEQVLTYPELDRRARSIAFLLTDQHKAAEERVLLLFPPGLDYIAAFFGCLYAGSVALPAYPPDIFRLERTLPRFLSVIQDALPAVALTTSPILTMLQPLLAQYPRLQAIRWATVDTLDEDQAASWTPPPIHPESLAFLQYTSGSTAEPKGVMLTHGNLLHNLAQITLSFGLNTDSRGVIWLPPYHDMGLIGGILGPLFAGLQVVLMSPLDFLQRPLRWLQAISRTQATHSGGPNFAYSICAKKVTEAQRAELDLSSWQIAFNGAEPVRADTMAIFSEAFASCGFRPEAFYPCYGLAENTLFVTGRSADSGPMVRLFLKGALGQGKAIPALGQEAPDQVVSLVSNGEAWLDQGVTIVDPQTRRACPEGVIGEIWLSGPSVAQGYWNRPQESRRTFGARLTGTDEGPFLRTGDLGFLLGGELFITGRIKDLIIIDGLNHYPQDIEYSVESCHPAVRPGGSAAFSIDGTVKEELVVIAEVKLPQDGMLTETLAEEIVAAIRSAVARNHDLRVHDVYLLRPRTIPKTSSGKIQRHVCRSAYLEGELEAWLPQS